MKISIHRVANRKHREMLREAVTFFLKELLPNHIFNKIRVGVDVNPRLTQWGFCSAKYPRTSSKIARPTNFLIEVRPHGWITEDLLKTIGHECVHVKQYATGEMSEVNYETTRWKSRHVNTDDTPYEKHPWEIEAAGNEELLWEMWKERDSFI